MVDVALYGGGPCIGHAVTSWAAEIQRVHDVVAAWFVVLVWRGGQPHVSWTQGGRVNAGFMVTELATVSPRTPFLCTGEARRSPRW